MNFVQSISEDDEQCSRKNHIHFVHVLLLKKKTFVTVTDAKGATKSKPGGQRRESNVNCYVSRVATKAIRVRRLSRANARRDSTVKENERNQTVAVAGEALESRLSRYAAEATAEHVGPRKMGLKSVVMKVKGSTFFSKKKKVILSWREGFRGSGVGDQSTILYIHDVTQLSHNGCRLPKKRRVQIAFWNL
nr:ribosomal protein S11 [Gastrodia javanica]